MCLLGIYTSSLEESLFRFSDKFLIELFACFFFFFRSASLFFFKNLLIYIYIFYFTINETTNKTKIRTLKWEKIFRKEAADKVLISKIYKKFMQLNIKNKQTVQDGEHVCLFLILSSINFLYILEINPLSVASFLNIFSIFSHFKDCIFVLFIVSFAVQNLLNLIRSHLLIFIFINLGDGSKKILLCSA